MDAKTPMISNQFTEIPCDLLLVLARKLDPEDYLGLSSTSKGIRNCLKTGRYTPEQEALAKDFIEEQKKKLREMLEDVKEYSENIAKYPNAPEKVKLAAVREDGTALHHIKNPSKKVIMTAVKQNGRMIDFIENPTEKMKLEAVKSDGTAIQYIENPSEEVQLAAVTQNGYAIEEIENPSEKVQLVAAKRGRMY